MLSEDRKVYQVVAPVKEVPFARAAFAYIAIHLATLVCVVIANLFTHHGLVNDLSIWDGQWFLQAVTRGWPRHLPMANGQVLANPTAFFPLFPLLLRWISFATRLSPSVVGLVISGASGLTAVFAVGLLTREFAGEEKAERAALLFAVSPGAFVFNLMYAEGILLTMVALGLIALLRRRWVLAGVCGAIATATSPVGMAFALSCLWSAILVARREHTWRPLIAPVIAPIGFVAWMGYLWIHTGTLMAWRITERDGWNSYPSLAYPFKILGKFLFNPISPTMTGQILFFGTTVTIVGVVLMIREHQPVPVLVYGISALFFSAISSPVGLRPRFIMIGFPIAIAAATRWSGRRYALVVAASFALLLLMTYEELTSFAVFP